ncbi:MAG: hypothetical protein V4640_08730 [Verrucomicrobiota bacterium]
MSLILGLAVAMLSVASLESRKRGQLDATATAKANARLALMQAIGQLQRTMGPDQRVSATAQILRQDVSQPHWTGVWRSTHENGDSIFSRDDLAGSLRDARWQGKMQSADHVIEWLVSGDDKPTGTIRNSVRLYQSTKTEPGVEVSRVEVKDAGGKVSGHLAWWTGDLGVRANLRTADPRANIVADPQSPANGGLYRVMASQAADMKLMSGGVETKNDDLNRMVSGGMVAFSDAGKTWALEHSLDFTVDSAGVLADVARGGLKQDLTAYFEKGEMASSMQLTGLKDDDPLVGEEAAGAAGRYQRAGPRFGLLRDWANMAVPFSGKTVAAKPPESDPSAGHDSDSRALANELPVKLAGNVKTGLHPILVEATNFTQISIYQEQNPSQRTWQIRQLLYPRVVLWNPYNCDLSFDRSIIMIQGNGRQEMWTRNISANGNRFDTQWLNFEGGRGTAFFDGSGLMNSSGYNDPYMGSYYFSIPATTFGPGECLVFSPARSAEYDGLSAYRPGNYNLDTNELSCTVSPDPARTYYVSASDIGGGMTFKPIEFWYAITPYWSQGGRKGVENQGDDTRAILKQVVGNGAISFENFDKLPQVAVLSGSLQYGAGREPRMQWAKDERMPIELLDRVIPKPTLIPNVRTRESIRLRWFDEHRSNLEGAGALANTPFFEDALLANWNPRAAFSLRSPWENIGGVAPWFFGAYTRDLFDGAVGWEDQAPVPRNGNYHGNPFGPPQEGHERYVLFDLPRDETGVISLGQLQHAKLSDLIWHPSYAIGNSLADPRLGTGGFDGLDRTAALPTDTSAADQGGFGPSEIGWSGDKQRSSGKDEWAANARSILADTPSNDNLVYDLSFEVNFKLWDRFFLSSGTAEEKAAFAAHPEGKPLPNSRMRLAPGISDDDTASHLTDFHRCASALMVDGAFNVNSTRVEAWKAMLGSTRKSGFGSADKIPFPRVLHPHGDAWSNSDPAYSDEVWSGFRELTEEEIGRLAESIVVEVKRRGPFLSMADFVNRRLATDETGKMGALQAAIENAGLNSGITDEYPLDNGSSLPDYKHPDNIPDATRMEQTLKPACKAWGAPAYLTQSDVLQVIGPALAARSDTFVIRAYGDAVNGSGKPQSRAWCEAVLQRTPRPIVPDDSGLNPRDPGTATDFGREFIITSFRWLSPDEI